MAGRHLMVGLLLSAVGAVPALAEGDAARGEQVFVRCKACHAADEEVNRIGPHLVDIFGREAGAVEDFSYSAALAGSDITWSEETLAAYLENPAQYVPGNKMMFNGLKDPEDLADVVAYLKSVSAGS